MEALNKSILIIEDEKPIRSLLHQKLSQEGFTVSDSVDGESGLKAALESRPDLIVLNLLLPKIGGIEVLRKLRENEWGREVPVVILTVMDVSDEMIKEIISQQPSYYFVKSDWKIDDVVAKIRQIFE